MTAKLLILASGSGSNAENLFHFFKESPQVEVTAFATNNPTAGVIERAQRLGIPCPVFTRDTFWSGEDFAAFIAPFHPDYIVLAGFLWKIPDHLIHRFPERIINIHPSLLPAFGGKGMYGAHVHTAVLAAGETQSGITIHLVNEHYDEGRILFQASCEVLPTDTPETLASRIHELEYRYFPQVIADFVIR